MRTTLEIDDDLITSAKELSQLEGRSLGSVISDLVRRGLTPAKGDSEDGLPVIKFLAELKKVGRHRFLVDGVSVTDDDSPEVHGYRQVTDAHLLAIAGSNSVPLVTFDSGVAELASPDQVMLLAR